MKRTPLPRNALASLAVCLLFAAAAPGQGLLINIQPEQHIRLPRPVIIIQPQPAPPSSYKIKQIDVQARVQEQIARVSVSQTFANTGSQQMEVCFVFPLPYDGAIDQLTLLVDGKEFPAKLLGKDEARRLYEATVRKNRDPALLEWMGTGLFKTSVFPLPPGAERKITLKYSQLCRKDHGLTDFLFPLSTAKYTSAPVDEVNVRVSIESKQEIKNVYSPTHAVQVERTPHSATVTYKAEKQVPSSDFRLFYDAGANDLAASVVSYRPKADDDGYLLLLASPPIKAPDAERAKKTVVLVLDRSGSMSGKKIEQAKEAAKFVVNNLREGDLFNLVIYDSAVESFRPELQKFNDETRQAALAYIAGVYAGGSTNIDGALTSALAQLQDSSRPNFVLFLTDGLPTTGESNEMKIVENARTHNKVHARVATFGVGYDVNSRLLDKLARENYGQSQYVRPEENIEGAVSSLYRRIESPVMTDVNLKFALDMKIEGEAVNRRYPKQTFDLFEGEQLVVVARYKGHGTAKVTVTGNVGGKQQSIDFPAELVEKSNDETNAFIEKLWAVRRVGEIIDEIDLKGKNDELVKELVELSTKHGVLTPYTSFLADETTQLQGVAANAASAARRLDALSVTEGRGGVLQRAAKAQLRDAERAPQAQEKLRFEFAEPTSTASPAALGAASGPAQAQPYQAGGGGISAPRSGTVPLYAGGAGAARGFGKASPAGRAGGSQPGGAPSVSQPYGIITEATEAGKKSDKDSLRNIGAKSFFRRDNRWVESTVTDEQMKKAKHVEQFSEEYFRLADKHGKKLAQYLVFDEPVLVQLDGDAYLIEPAKADK